ncbi:MAG: 2-dehydropantoate 2-reductase (Ketopantoate reductase), KPA reductase, KPR [candidate division NC10 bacterium CSP1-5]|nr:MAG: 2-dehydropantoate 2-reductase (Ketopantoate reductase), KPA reductase, KPR [candidate division NC10 bacterium CSP1-5]
MKIAVMGAGAVGGYFGALLHRGGLDVTLIARGRHLEAIKAHGLRIKSTQGDLTVPAKAVGDPRAVGPVDLILFCVKSYDTESAARQCLPIVQESTAILCLQNGVDNEEKIAMVAGGEKVLGGVAYIGAGVSEPGVVVHTAEGRIVFGEMRGGVSERVRRLEQIFRDAGFPAEVSSNIQAILWGKLCWNAAFNALNTLVGGDVRVLVERPETRTLARQAMEEVRAVANANNVPLSADLAERLLTWTDTAAGAMKTSTRQDLEAGKRLEVEALNGAVVRKGEAAGVPTPFNFALYALLKAIDPGA